MNEQSLQHKWKHLDVQTFFSMYRGLISNWAQVRQIINDLYCGVSGGARQNGGEICAEAANSADLIAVLRLQLGWSACCGGLWGASSPKGAE